MKRLLTFLTLLLFAAPSFACVGKSLVVGADSTPEGRAVAQVLAILINERTGTTVEIVEKPDSDGIFKEMTEGDMDLALDYTVRALKRAGKDVPNTSEAAMDEAKKVSMESFNIVWLTPFGFTEPGNQNSIGATVAQKHALKTFPALPRLIAKASNFLDADAVKSITGSSNMAKAARDFLKKNKLI